MKLIIQFLTYCNESNTAQSCVVFENDTEQCQSLVKRHPGRVKLINFSCWCRNGLMTIGTCVTAKYTWLTWIEKRRSSHLL